MGFKVLTDRILELLPIMFVSWKSSEEVNLLSYKQEYLDEPAKLNRELIKSKEVKTNKRANRFLSKFEYI